MSQESDWEETVVTIIKHESMRQKKENFHSCNQCPYKTKLSSAIEKHMQQHYSNVKDGVKPFNCSKVILEQYKCDICCFETPLMMDFNKHLIEAHVLTATVDIELLYTCRSCNFHTFSLLILLKHAQKNCWKKVFEYHKWFLCKKCHYKAKTKTVLENHLTLQHHSKSNHNKYKCNQCSYKSHNKYYLNYHIQHQHSAPENVKWFNCQQCSYHTKKQGHLNRHVTAKHTPTEQVTWYKCDQCPYKSKQKSTLKRHSLQHMAPEDIAWVYCKTCSFKTKDNYLLKLHVRRIHTREVKRFECGQCSYKARKLYHFNEHVSSKHGYSEDVRSFKCDKCPFKSAWKRALKHHTVNKHKFDDVRDT